MTLLEFAEDGETLLGEDMDAIMDSDDYTNAFDLLQQLGVDVVAACRFVNDLKRMPTQTFMELSGRGKIVEAAAHGKRRPLNCRSLAALDLRTPKRNGEPWNLSKKEDQQLAEDMVLRQKPDWLTGSPPCTPCRSFNWGLNFSKMDPKRVEEILRKPKDYLRFVIRLYRIQLDQGRHFLHEHPQSARSWQDEHMVDLLADPRVGITVSDQCEYGLFTPGPDGQPRRAKKPPQWACPSPWMLKRLSKRCAGGHTHQHIIGGRAKQAVFYQLKLVVKLPRCMRDNADAKAVDDDPEEVAMKVSAALNSNFTDSIRNLHSTYPREALVSNIASRKRMGKIPRRDSAQHRR